MPKSLRIEVEDYLEIRTLAWRVFERVQFLAVDLLETGILEFWIPFLQLQERPRGRQCSTNQALFDDDVIRRKKLLQLRAAAGPKLANRSLASVKLEPRRRIF